MYTVLIVDDERLIRKRIRFGFDWERYGYRVTDEAANGEEALTSMEKQKPDLAIIDVAMPGMNGLELVKEIRHRGYDTSLIILTGHSKFEYAREAIRHGVFAYVLKPIHEEEMIETLQRLTVEKEMRALSASAKPVQPRDHALLAAIRGETESAISEDCVWESACRVSLLRFDVLPSEKEQAEIRALWPLAYLTAEPTHTNTLLLLFQDNGRGDEACLRALHAAQEHVTSAKLRYLTLSNSFCGISNVQKAYRQAERILRNAPLLSPSPQTYAELLPFLQIRYEPPHEKVEKFRKWMYAGEEQNARLLLAEVFSQAFRDNIPHSAWRQMLRRFIAIADEAALDFGCAELCDHRWHTDLLTLLENGGSAMTMAKELTGCLSKLLEHIRNESEVRLTHQVQRYIQQNYADPQLSVTTIAAAFNVSVSHISRTFKQEAGISTIGYITKTRMEYANILLRSGMQVQQVAERIGYHDEYYFSRCYKKHFGGSPVAARRMLHTGV